jgi:hypothetical protein
MPSFFFPCLGLVPDVLPALTEAPGAALRCREWQTTTFDFATLGASHQLHFSWHLLDHPCHPVRSGLNALACGQ